jgi:hypothetical protein
MGWCNYIALSGVSLFLQFNFVGKLLGPKGNSMKRLLEDTMTKMAVLGRGSMKDKQKVRIFVYCIRQDSSLFLTIEFLLFQQENAVKNKRS